MGLFVILGCVCIMWSGIKEMRLIMILWRSLYFSMYYMEMGLLNILLDYFINCGCNNGVY